MLNFGFLGKGLELVSSPHLYNISRIMFLMLYSFYMPFMLMLLNEHGFTVIRKKDQ